MHFFSFIFLCLEATGAAWVFCGKQHLHGHSPIKCYRCLIQFSLKSYVLAVFPKHENDVFFFCRKKQEINFIRSNTATAIGDRRFQIVTAKFLNLLPIEIRTVTSVVTFKKLLKGVLHPWALFLKPLCIFSKNKAISDKVSYGSGQKCSKELKNHSFTSVETIVVKLQWKMCENQYFPCFEP